MAVKMTSSDNIIEQLKKEEQKGLLCKNIENEIQENFRSYKQDDKNPNQEKKFHTYKQLYSGVENREFKDLLTLISDRIWEIDSNGKYVFIDGGKEILGYEPKEIIGKTPFELMPKEEAERINREFMKLFLGKKPIVNLENWNLTRNGDKICFLTNGIPLFDERGELTGYKGFDKDITKKKKAENHADKILENRNALFRILYDSAIEVEGADSKKIFKILCRNLRKICKAKYAALASFDSKSNLIKLESIDFDEKSCDINENVTYSINEEIINDFKHRQISKCEQHHNCLVDFFPDFLPAKSSLSDNSTNCYRLSCIRNGNLIALGLVQLPENKRLKMKDIVDTYLNLAGMVIERIYDTKAVAESEMLYRNLSKDLEKKVKERTLEVENLLKLKDEFINQLGHDLKNPLGPLINLLPILEKKTKNPDCKDIFDVLIRNTTHMRNLVIKTISLAQLSSPQSELILESLMLKDEINNMLLKNKVLFETNTIEIENNVSDTITIKADKLRLTELMDNIVSNAIKYSLDYCKISFFAEENEDFITIKIEDTGIGMNEDQIKHIFDEFYKADPSRHDFDSSGLGMPISKRIVEKHGGRIWVKSEGLGKGTTVFFTIPKSITSTVS
jgi:PAS domain S-box-containing protein